MFFLHGICDFLTLNLNSNTRNPEVYSKVIQWTYTRNILIFIYNFTWNSCVMLDPFTFIYYLLDNAFITKLFVWTRVDLCNLQMYNSLVIIFSVLSCFCTDNLIPHRKLIWKWFIGLQTNKRKLSYIIYINFAANFKNFNYIYCWCN